MCNIFYVSSQQMPRRMERVGESGISWSGCSRRIYLQKEIEAEHASTMIQHRETWGTFRTVNPRQRKQVRNNNPQSADNQRPTAHTQVMRQKLQHSTQHQIQYYSGSTVGTVAPTRAASSGIYMQRFPIYHLIPFDQGYTELSKSG
jgi:hypothetical protein